MVKKQIERVRLLMDLVEDSFKEQEAHAIEYAKYKKEYEIWTGEAKTAEEVRESWRTRPWPPTAPSKDKLRREMLMLRQETIKLDKML